MVLSGELTPEAQRNTPLAYVSSFFAFPAVGPLNNPQTSFPIFQIIHIKSKVFGVVYLQKKLQLFFSVTSIVLLLLLVVELFYNCRKNKLLQF